MIQYVEITSVLGRHVKLWRSLQKSRAARVENGLFLAEGEHMTQEALRSGTVEALIVRADVLDKYRYMTDLACVKVYLTSTHVMEAVSETKTPQGVMALCRLPAPATVRGTHLVALDGVQDPGNVGTLIRTMDAAGFDTLLMDEKTADPYAGKTMRASMGGVFRVGLERCPDLCTTLRTLKNEGYAIWAGDLHGEPFFDRAPLADGRVCIVVGNEGAGVRPEILSLATHRLKLPMAGGAESLNAAVAGSIMIYDVLREQSTKK